MWGQHYLDRLQVGSDLGYSLNLAENASMKLWSMSTLPSKLPVTLMLVQSSEVGPRRQINPQLVGFRTAKQNSQKQSKGLMFDKELQKKIPPDSFWVSLSLEAPCESFRALWACEERGGGGISKTHAAITSRKDILRTAQCAHVSQPDTQVWRSNLLRNRLQKSLVHKQTHTIRFMTNPYVNDADQSSELEAIRI